MLTILEESKSSSKESKRGQKEHSFLGGHGSINGGCFGILCTIVHEQLQRQFLK
jgi:hypothetical protein